MQVNDKRKQQFVMTAGRQFNILFSERRQRSPDDAGSGGGYHAVREQGE